MFGSPLEPMSLPIYQDSTAGDKALNSNENNILDNDTSLPDEINYDISKQNSSLAPFTQNSQNLFAQRTKI